MVLLLWPWHWGWQLGGRTLHLISNWWLFVLDKKIWYRQNKDILKDPSPIYCKGYKSSLISTNYNGHSSHWKGHLLTAAGFICFSLPNTHKMAPIIPLLQQFMLLLWLELHNWRKCSASHICRSCDWISEAAIG